MKLNSQLAKALAAKDFDSGVRILKKRPIFGKKADLNQIKLQHRRFFDDIHPLLLWIYEHDPSAVKWAIQNGADVNVIDSREDGVLAGRNNSALIVAILMLRLASDLNKLNDRFQIVRMLIQARANPNHMGDNGMTPLRYACSTFNWINEESVGPGALQVRTELVKILLDAGADARVAVAGCTVFHDICTTPHDRVPLIESNRTLIDIMISAGAVPNIDDNGDTPLLAAAKMAVGCGGVASAVYLCELDYLDPDAVDRTGLTALHHVAYGGMHEAVKMLLDVGADPLKLDPNGQTALDAARERAGRKVDSESLGHFDPFKTVAILEEALRNRTTD